ncbi:hypothetical protein GUJ93_ZPchr0003g18262 [Zizania palustris]|uniref:Uncharacterized protein n=1 Tax=Zizania palustris TaxID=103762 RepID=A0A8J5SAY3_ZIZPA|nr:hypothetical protein GUJ93_ZPchr0003g18262 [Zizania palustris]
MFEEVSSDIIRSAVGVQRGGRSSRRERRIWVFGAAREILALKNFFCYNCVLKNFFCYNLCIDVCVPVALGGRSTRRRVGRSLASPLGVRRRSRALGAAGGASPLGVRRRFATSFVLMYANLGVFAISFVLMYAYLFRSATVRRGDESVVASCGCSAPRLDDRRRSWAFDAVAGWSPRRPTTRRETGGKIDRRRFWAFGATVG